MERDDVIELRVHGVSGTPPEDLLARPLVRQVAGDATAGFYRPRLAAERTDGDGGPELEGYAWGGLTSGAASRAFWLLLLPFTLLNVAPRLRPDRGDGRFVWWVSRVLALAATVMLTLGVVGISVDLGGWQCGADRTLCTKASPHWLMWPLDQLATGPRLALSLTVPFVFLLILWWLSRKTLSAYEAVGGSRVVPPGPGDADPRLDSPVMWRNENLVRRLRGVHLRTGVAVVLGSALPAAGPDRVTVPAGVLLAVVVLAGIGLLAVPSYVSRGIAYDKVDVALWAVLALVAVVELPWLCIDGHVVHGTGGNPGLPGYDGALGWLFLAMSALLVLLALAVRWTPGVGLAGTGSVVLAMFGVFAAAVFAGGAYMAVVGWLATGSLKPDFTGFLDASANFDVPDVVGLATLSYTVALLGLVAVLVLVGPPVWISLGRRATALLAAPSTEDVGRKARNRTVRNDYRLGLAVDSAGKVIGPLAVIGAVLLAVAVVVLAYGVAGDPGPLHALVPESKADQPGTLVRIRAAGFYLLAGSLVLLVGLGAVAFRVRATRRSVGVLWDIASFWPRVGHPLAAPCYAERTVPDLLTRVEYLAATRPVLLAAHSQGTVISAATLLQLRPETVPRVGLLTFGCVLRRLYSRYFPAYFGPPTLAEVRGMLTSAGSTRWKNLWRFSDYLGGRVESDPCEDPLSCPAGPALTAVDEARARQLADPAGLDVGFVDPVYDRQPGDTVHPRPGRHSDFWADPDYQVAVAEVARRIPTG